MILSVVRAMIRVNALTFWRDRAGVGLAFLLPPLVFLVFASVFGAGVSGTLDIRAAVVDQIGSPESRTLVAAVRTRLGGRLQAAPSVEALDAAVAVGDADAGLLLHGRLDEDAHPVTVRVDPAKRAAAEVLAAQTLAAAGTALPRLMLDREAVQLAPIMQFTADQRRRLQLAPLGAQGSGGASAAQADFIDRQTVGAGGDPLVIYYAAGVSVLFLMFTAMQGAFGLIEERRVGIRQRLALSAGGVAPILAGRMLWLAGLGAAQSLAVFALAALAYHIPLLASLLPWAVTAVCAAAACSGLALALASACATREQAQTLSTFVILILGAIGGSMAPRFLMPASLRALGWLTPNAWAITAYQGVLWRRVVDGRVCEAWAALLAFGAAGLVAVLLIESRRRA